MLKKFCFASLLLVAAYAGMGSLSLGLENEVATAEASADLVEDLEIMQGDWEMKAMQNGDEYRLHKIIAGNVDTLSVYRNGSLIQKQTATLELKEMGPVKVYHWTNGKMIVGPSAGTSFADGSFIYRLDKNRWVGVHGMLSGDVNNFNVEDFRRVESESK